MFDKQVELSVVLSCIFALSLLTTNRLQGLSLRWATSSDDESRETNNNILIVDTLTCSHDKEEEKHIINIPRTEYRWVSATLSKVPILSIGT